MTPFTGTGVSLLFDAALRGTLVLVAASLLAITMRRGSAASRHLVWQLALLAVLALPLVKAVSPLQLAVLPAFRSPIAVPVEPAPAEPASAPAVRSQENTAKELDAKGATAPANLVPVTPNVESAASSEAAPTLIVRIVFWLALTWLAVAALLMLRLLSGFVLVRWFALRAYPLYEDGWHELNRELAHAIGLKDSVHLLGSPHIATPITWGRTVMLPSSAEDWSDERRRVVLLHELAHIRRKDALAHMFAQLACAVYWFHPLVWKAAARMRAEAERACDDLVLRTGTRASVYADHLLDLIRTIGGMRTPAVALPMAQRSTFEGRLLAILEPHLDRSAPRPLAVAGMVLVVGLIVLPLAGLTSQQLNATVMNSGLIGEETSARKSHADAPSTKQPTSNMKESSFARAYTYTETDVKTNTSVMRYSDQSAQQQISGAAMQSLLNALADADTEVRASAAQSLGQLGDERAVAALSKALREDSDARVRRTAAWALGNIEDARAVPALVHAVKNDQDGEVRRTAVWALGQIEDESAVPALTDLVRDRDVEMRRQAAWALGQIQAEAAVPALVTALRDSDAEVRSTAVWALGQIEAESAVEPLTGLLNDATPEVRKQAVWALGQIEAESAVPALARVVREDRDVETRQQAAWALGQIESASAVPALSAALKDANASVRKQAAWALGQTEARPAPAALQEALKDSDAEVRATAAWALGQIEDPGSAAALRGALRDETPMVRRAVLRALTQLGDQAGYEALAEMLKDPDPEVRRAAAAALGGHGGAYVDPRPEPQPQPRPRPRPIN